MEFLTIMPKLHDGYILVNSNCKGQSDRSIWLVKGASKCYNGELGPVAQSIVSLMSSLVDKMLTVLVIKISNSQVFLLKKM